MGLRLSEVKAAGSRFGVLPPKASERKGHTSLTLNAKP